MLSWLLARLNNEPKKGIRPKKGTKSLASLTLLSYNPPSTVVSPFFTKTSVVARRVVIEGTPLTIAEFEVTNTLFED